MKKKGFTLIELLVAISIMGVIMIIAIPAVNTLVNSNKEKKYEAYAKSLENAARLYVDENEKEAFGFYDGCSEIDYETLEKAHLIKSFPDSKINCNSSNTFVKVHKAGQQYFYETSLYCQDNKGKKKYDHVLDHTCDLVEDKTGPTLTVTDPSSNWTTTSNMSDITLRLTDEDGGLGFEYNKKIKYQWVKGTGNPVSSKWKTLHMGNEPIKEKNLSAKISKNINPNNDFGQYYLWIDYTSLGDILGNNKYKSNQSKGPFKIDDKPPTVSLTKTQNKFQRRASDDSGASGLAGYNYNKGSCNYNSLTTASSLNDTTSGYFDGQSYYLCAKDKAGNTAKTNATSYKYCDTKTLKKTNRRDANSNVGELAYYEYTYSTRSCTGSVKTRTYLATRNYCECYVDTYASPYHYCSVGPLTAADTFKETHDDNTIVVRYANNANGQKACQNNGNPINSYVTSVCEEGLGNNAAIYWHGYVWYKEKPSGMITGFDSTKYLYPSNSGYSSNFREFAASNLININSGISTACDKVCKIKFSHY